MAVLSPKPPDRSSTMAKNTSTKSKSAQGGKSGKTGKTGKSRKSASPAKAAATDNGRSSAPAGSVVPAASPAAGSSGPAIDIGISAEDRQEIATALSHFLADAYTLHLKTHNFHWNVTGPMFNALHNMFEVQYTEQWNALDDIAE